MYPKFTDYDVRFYIYELLKVCCEKMHPGILLIYVVRLWITVTAKASCTVT